MTNDERTRLKEYTVEKEAMPKDVLHKFDSAVRKALDTDKMFTACEAIAAFFEEEQATMSDDWQHGGDSFLGRIEFHLMDLFVSLIDDLDAKQDGAGKPL